MAQPSQVLNRDTTTADWDTTTSVWSQPDGGLPYTTWANQYVAVFQSNLAQTLTVTQAVSAIGLQFAGRNVTIDGSAAVTINGGQGFSPYIWPQQTGVAVTVSAPLAGTKGAVVYAPGGSGAASVLTLGGANTYTGTTTFSSFFTGTLTVKMGLSTVGSTGPLGALTNPLDLQSTTTTLDLNGFTVRIGGLSGSGPISNSSAGTATLVAGNDNSSSTYTGTMAGNLRFTKAGSGTMLLNGANSFTGGVVVDNGTLAVDGNQDLNRLAANSAITVNSGGTFQARGINALPTGSNAIDVTINNGGLLSVVSGGSAATGSGGTSHMHLRNLVLIGGSVVLDYAGNGTPYNGQSFLLNGDLTATGTSSITRGSGATASNTGIALNGVRTLNVTNAADVLTIGARLRDEPTISASGVIKTGAGTLTLTDTNAYSGGTTVSAGSLWANAASATGTGAVTVASGARLGGQGSVGAVTINGTITAGTSDTATGTLTATGQTWKAGGRYAWKVSNAGGVAGGTSGWDLLSMSTLDLTGVTTSNPFTIVASKTATGVLGTLAAGKTFLIADLPGANAVALPVGTPIADLFVLDVSALVSDTSYNPAGFELRFDSGDISIAYAAAPEPGTAALYALAVTPALLRRRKRQATSCYWSSRPVAAKR